MYPLPRPSRLLGSGGNKSAGIRGHIEMNLRVNESRTDRLVRIALGIGLLLVGTTSGVTAPLLYIVWVVAAIAIGTGVVGFCAIYALLGLSTKREVLASR
jgi:Protein of unknown function (DUF2892)